MDKSGIISFSGKRYEVGIKYVGERIDIVYDSSNPDVLTAEIKGELPFQIHEVQIGEHTARKAKAKPPERIPAARSRLIDGAIKTATSNINRHKAAISYKAESEVNCNV